MICTIHGMVCQVSESVNKNTGEVTPTVHVFSGDEAIRISGLVVDSKKLGQQIDVVCEVKTRSFEGRTYTTYKAINL